MADEITPQGESVTPESEAEQQPAEVDWKAESRKWEARAKENLATAKANEAAAKRLAQIEESQKTEAQRQQDALEQAQRELAEERSARIRAEVAAEKGVPAHLLTGSSREDMESAADELLKFRGDVKPRISVPNEGNDRRVELSKGAQFASFLNGQLNAG